MIINKNEFAYALGKISKVCKNTDSLYSTNMISIYAENDNLCLYAGNPIMTVETKIEAKFDGEPFYETVVLAKQLIGVINKLPTSVKELNLKSERGIFYVTAGNFSVRFNDTQSPILKNYLGEQEKINVSSDTLKKAVKGVLHASTDKVDDSVLASVNIEGSSVYAMDTYRLSVRNINKTVGDNAMLVYAKDLAAALQFFDGDFELKKSKGYVELSDEKTVCTIALCSRKFYCVDKIIEKKQTNTVLIQKKSLVDILNVISVLEEKALFCFKGNTLEIKSTSNFTDSQFLCDTEIVNGNCYAKINLNVSYLLDSLKSLSDETVEISFSGSRDIIYITNSSKEEEYICPMAM